MTLWVEGGCKGYREAGMGRHSKDRGERCSKGDKLARYMMRQRDGREKLCLPLVVEVFVHMKEGCEERVKERERD